VVALCEPLARSRASWRPDNPDLSRWSVAEEPGPTTSPPSSSSDGEPDPPVFSVFSRQRRRSQRAGAGAVATTEMGAGGSPSGGESEGVVAAGCPEPREWGRFAQWAMKPVTRVVFNRSTVTFFSTRTPRLQSLCYYDVTRSPGVEGHVALTFDDAPCRQGPGRSQMQTVLEMLRAYDVQATFMTVGAFIPGHEEDLSDVLRAGHELGNHGMMDRPYHKDTPEAFAEAVDQCSAHIRALQRQAGVAEGVRWFRAPHGKYTRAMADTLRAKGLENVMCDTYASCPIIQDGEFIGNFLADQARHGSIILLHMPETNFREWCATALTRLLEGLARRRLRAVSVGQLSALAGSEATAATAASLQ